MFFFLNFILNNIRENFLIDIVKFLKKKTSNYFKIIQKRERERRKLEKKIKDLKEEENKISNREKF